MGSEHLQATIPTSSFALPLFSPQLQVMRTLQAPHLLILVDIKDEQSKY